MVPAACQDGAEVYAGSPTRRPCAARISRQQEPHDSAPCGTVGVVFRRRLCGNRVDQRLIFRPTRRRSRTRPAPTQNGNRAAHASHLQRTRRRRRRSSRCSRRPQIQKARTMKARPRLLLVVVAIAPFVSVSAGGAAVTDVKSYGAKGDGIHDDTKPLMTAWKAACGSAGAVTMVLSPGTYYIGPVQFHGPCRASTLTFQLQGTLKAATDLNRFGNDWIEFGWVTGLTVAGGVIDGQGAASWPFNECPVRKDCRVLPTSVLFVNNRNTVVRDVTSVNPKFFHIALLQAKNVRLSGLRISAPPDSPNTDGIHIERSAGVSITDTRIGTGDDCISIGQGSDRVDVARVACGPGHGVSVGSLGRYAGEGDVTRVHVRDITFTGTMNGVRIKTWENSPSRSSAAHMLFENMVMEDVQNPIIIDQKYCPYDTCEHKYVSGVTLRDVRFKNIKGTTTTPVAVMLRCGVPCQGLVLQDVDLKYKGLGGTSAKCENAEAKYVGYQFPEPCT